MAKAILLISILGFFHLVQSHGTALTANDMRVFEIYKNAYYDPLTNLTLKSEIEDSARLPYTRIGFRSLPCACQDLSCGCCAGINITRIKFDQKACTNFTYDPYKFSIKMDLDMNDRRVFSNEISAKNPPPICTGLPYIPLLEFCIRFHNVFMPGNNIHACIDLETRIMQASILVLHYDCIRMGADGIVWLKPEEDGGLDVDDESPIIEEPEVYDEVNFESSDSGDQQNGNSSLVLSSEEDDDHIGQLKL